MDKESQEKAEDLFLHGIPGPLGSMDEDADAGRRKSRGSPGNRGNSPGCSTFLALTLAIAILAVL